MLKLIFKSFKSKNHTKNIVKKFFSRKEALRMSKTTNLNSLVNLPKSERNNEELDTTQNVAEGLPLTKKISLDIIDKFLVKNHQVGNPSLNKYFADVKNSLGPLLENNKFLASCQQILLNYSNSKEEFSNTTLFRFLVFIDQIIKPKSLDFYTNYKIEHKAFPHFFESFSINFVELFKQNADMLLKYNFLHFMSKNAGEFSDCIYAMLEENSFKENVKNLLKSKIVSRKSLKGSEISYLIRKIETEGADIKTPSTDMIHDFSFKYNEKYMKEKMIKESIKQKRVYRKLKAVYNNLLQIDLEQINQKLLEDLEVFLSTNFLQQSQEIFDEEYASLKNKLNDLDKVIQNQVTSLTKLQPSSLIAKKISSENIEDVFDPQFSGEFLLEVQFAKVVEAFDEAYAFTLLEKYISSQLEDGQVYSFHDLVNFNILQAEISNGHFEIIHYDIKDLENLEIHVKPTSKEKSKQVVHENVTKGVKKESDIVTKLRSEKMHIPKKQDTKAEKINSSLKNEQTYEKKPFEKKSQTIQKEFFVKKSVKKQINEPKKFSKIYEKEIEEITKPIKEAVEKDLHKLPPDHIKEDLFKEVSDFDKVIEKEIQVDKNNSAKNNEKGEPAKEMPVIENTKTVEMTESDIQSEIKTSKQLKAKITPDPDLKKETFEKMNNVSENPPLEKIVESAASSKDYPTIKKASNLTPQERKFTRNKDRMKTFYKTNKTDFSSKFSREINDDNIKKDKSMFFVVPEKENKHKERSSRLVIPERKEKEMSTEDNQIEGTKSKPLFVSIKRQKESEMIKDHSTKKPKFVIPSEKSSTVTDKEDTSSRFKFFQPISSSNRRPINETANLKDLKIFSRDFKEEIISKLEEVSKKLKNIQPERINYGLPEDEQKKQNLLLHKSIKKFNATFWKKKLINIEKEFVEKEVRQIALIKKLAETFRECENDQEATKKLIYSLLNPRLKSKLDSDLRMIFYHIYMLSGQRLFLFNLGHIAYQILLEINLADDTLENRVRLEKLMYHMNIHSYVPNNKNIQAIIQICDKNYYPSYLKVIIDDLVIHKGIQLSPENFKDYIQIITNFPELKEYYTNLIDNSFNEFQIPLKADFVIFLLQRYIVESNENQIRQLFDFVEKRYYADYENEVTRYEENYVGNKLLLKTICECYTYPEKYAHLKLQTDQDTKNIFNQIKKVVSDLAELIDTSIIEANKKLKPDWDTDLEYLQLLELYYSKVNRNLVGYSEVLLKMDKNFPYAFNASLFRDIVKIASTESMNEGLGNKIMGVLRIFLDKYAYDYKVLLDFEDRLFIVRYEILPGLYDFFKRQAELESLRDLVVFVFDESLYAALGRKDKYLLKKFFPEINFSRYTLTNRHKSLRRNLPDVDAEGENRLADFDQFNEDEELNEEIEKERNELI